MAEKLCALKKKGGGGGGTSAVFKGNVVKLCSTPAIEPVSSAVQIVQRAAGQATSAIIDVSDYSSAKVTMSATPRGYGSVTFIDSNGVIVARDLLINSNNTKTFNIGSYDYMYLAWTVDNSSATATITLS